MVVLLKKKMFYHDENDSTLTAIGDSEINIHEYESKCKHIFLLLAEFHIPFSSMHSL